MTPRQPESTAEPAPLEPLLTAEDIAAIARVSVRTVRRWSDGGLLPGTIRIASTVRWRRADIEAFLRGEWKAPRARGGK